MKYIIIIVSVAVSASIAQTYLDEQFNIAKKLYDEENYFDAITELKRLLFFDKSGSYNFEANMLIGECYKQGAKFSDAIHYYTLAEIGSKNIEELYPAKTNIIRINILRRTTDRALKLLDSLEADPRFKDKNEELNYWRGWAYMFADDWENASLVFGEIDSVQIIKKLSDKVINELYSEPFAKTISYIIPGSGQIFVGEYVSGILSFGWNVLFGYLSINSFIEERIFDGIVITNFLWYRFYRGNLQNAENFAEDKNLEIMNNALNWLQFEYKGLKP